MIEFIRLCTDFVAAVLKSRAGLQAENLALRHQLCVYQRNVKRPKVKPADRILLSLLASKAPNATASTPSPTCATFSCEPRPNPTPASTNSSPTDGKPVYNPDTQPPRKATCFTGRLRRNRVHGPARS